MMSVKIKELLQSAKFKKVLCRIAVIAVALIIFQVGVFVGYHKAAFSYRWGENYYRTFGGPGRHMLWGMPRGEFSEAHGVAGKVIKVDLPTIVVESEDKLEKMILIKDNTIVVRFRDTVKPTDIKPDDFVVIIGAPNDQAQIEARLIRLAPPPSDFQNKEMERQTR